MPLLNGPAGNVNQSEEKRVIPLKLAESVKQSGWKTETVDELSFLIRNSEGISAADYTVLEESPNHFYKTYLLSLLLKKEGRYREIYDSLSMHLDTLPEYYSYLDELVFAANASGMLDNLESGLRGMDSSAYVLYLNGLMQSARGKFGLASGYYQKAYLYDTLSTSILFQLASAERSLGHYTEASGHLHKLLALAENDAEAASSANLSIGALHFLSGDYKTSAKYYQKALGIALTSNDRYHEARAYINIGINEDIDGNIDKARNYFNKANLISEKIRDHQLTALCLSELGVSYSFTYDLVSAKKNYLRSYDLFQKTGTRTRLALLSENIGKIYSQLYDYSGAAGYFKSGIEYAGENKRALYLNKSGLADVYNNLGNYAEALKLYRECEKLSDEIEDNYLKGETSRSLGILNYNLGRYDKAVEYYKKAGTYFADDLWYSAGVSHKLGLAFASMDSADIAERYFSAAAEAALESKDDYLYTVSLIDLADVKLKEGQYTDAQVLLKKAGTTADKNDFDNLRAELYMTQGRILSESQQDFQGARRSFTRSVEISRSTGNTTLLTEGLYKLALLHEKFNLPELAESYYKQALYEAESKGRFLFEDQEVQISFYNLNTDIYNSFANFYLKQEKYNQAFQIIDRGRSRNSIQNLANIKLRSLVKQDSLIDKLYEYGWIMQSGVYDSLTVDSVSLLYSALNESILQMVPEAESYLGSGRYYTVGEIQKNLAPDENIVLIYPSEQRTYLLRISSSSFDVDQADISYRQIKELVSSISPFYKEENNYSFYNQDLFAFNAEVSSELYSKLLKKTISGIPQNNRIVFVPSIGMLLVPFEFLVTRFNDNQSAYSYSDKSFLVNYYNISYATSVSAYINQKQAQPANEDKYLVVGNPFFSSNQELVADRRSLLSNDTLAILPLKYSADEVNEVGSILKTNTILTDRNATETNFREYAQNSRIIHISTHSYLMNKQPVIFFSNFNDERNDGFLETSEIVQMNLNSDLVVLSSCNSGMGRIEEAEGVVGMAKAFFEAGTKSVIVSLWEVNDRYTSAFMTLFYNHLSRGLSKTESLRNAKLEFMKEYSANPYYWGAFVLNGNTDRVILKSGSGLNSFALPAVIFIIVLFVFIYYMRRKNKAAAKTLS